MLTSSTIKLNVRFHVFFFQPMGDAVYLQQQPRGQGKDTAFTKLATCTGWIIYAKIRISRPQDSVSPTSLPPMTPECGNARRVAPGHVGVRGGSDTWKEKPPVKIPCFLRTNTFIMIIVNFLLKYYC